jgi:hypothetical protein
MECTYHTSSDVLSKHCRCNNLAMIQPSFFHSFTIQSIFFQRVSTQGHLFGTAVSEASPKEMVAFVLLVNLFLLGKLRDNSPRNSPHLDWVKLFRR